MTLQEYPSYAETNRLQMRRLNLDDCRNWQRFLNDNRCTTYFPDFMKNGGTLQSLTWVEKQICRYRDKKGGLMALIEKNTGLFVGQCGLLVQDVNGQAEIEIGYHLLPEHWGKGFASEAAEYYKKIGFQISAADSIISIIDVNNIPSQKVARKNGFRNRERTLWRNLDVYVFRILRSEMRP